MWVGMWDNLALLPLIRWIEKFEGPNMILEYSPKSVRSLTSLLTTYTAMVVLPYSLHSASVLDSYYGLAIPHLVPSLKFLASMHESLGVCEHTAPGNVPCYKAGDPLVLLPNHHKSPCCGTSSESCKSPVEDIERWLAMSDLYQLPNLIYFDSYAHLPELLQKLSDPGSPARRLLPHIGQQIRRDTERFINTTHARVLDVLEHMLT